MVMINAAIEDAENPPVVKEEVPVPRQVTGANSAPLGAVLPVTSEACRSLSRSLHPSLPVKPEPSRALPPGSMVSQPGTLALSLGKRTHDQMEGRKILQNGSPGEVVERSLPILDPGECVEYYCCGLV